jgi:ribosomal protein S18 acetylase RimI-like enzyme
MIMKYKIIKSTKKDKKWLFDLHKKTMKEYVEKIYGWDEHKEQKFFEDLSRISRYHIILENKKRVGAISYNQDDKVIMIFRIEILPEYQNKGIGACILDSFIDLAKRDKKIIELRVFKINPAQRLYLRKGFSIYKESDTHYYIRYEK